MTKQMLAALGILSLTALSIALFPHGSHATGPADTATVTNPSGTVQTNYPYQFGRPFVDGEIPGYPQVLINGAPALTQADVKNRYADGSVKYAVISIIIPSIPTSGAVTLSFQNQASGNNTALTQAQMLDPSYNFDATIQLTSGGVTQSVSARQMLQDNSYTVWASGPVATTILLADDSTARKYDMGFDSYRSFRPRFYATFWPATHQVTVRYVGEDSSLGDLENISYDLSLSLGESGPTTVFTQASVAQAFLTRWTKVFWINGTPQQEINIDNNLAYLESTDYFPNFDPSVSIPAATLTQIYYDWGKSAHTDVGDPGLWTTYMPTTGGRDDIGPIPTWAADWLYSGDWRARTVALGLSDLAGGWSLNARETNPAKKIDKAQTVSGMGLPISAYAYPTTWFPNNNGSYSQLALQSKPSNSGSWVTDNAHQPDAFYTQYVLTGDYYYLEGEQMWAAMDALSENRAYGGWTQGIQDQLRGNAWDLRTRANAAFITPDSQTTLKTYFTNLTDDALAVFDGHFGITSDGYQGTAEWNWSNTNASFLPDPLHFFDCGTGAVDCSTAPWQQSYFDVVLGMLKERGFKTGGLLSYLGANLTNQVSAPGYDPYNLSSYWIQSKDDSGSPYPTFAALQTANLAIGNMVASGDFGVTSPGNYYPVLATAASSFLTSDDGGASWNWLNPKVRGADWQRDYDGSGEIEWDILPRGTITAPPPTLPSAPTISSVTVGSGASQFSLASLSCSPNQASATSCTATVTFAPTASGSFTDSLTAQDSDGVTHVISLSGTGVGTTPPAQATTTTTVTPPTTTPPATPAPPAQTATGTNTNSNNTTNTNGTKGSGSATSATGTITANSNSGAIDVPMSVHTVTGTGTYNVALLDWGTNHAADPSWFSFKKNADGSYVIQDVHASGYALILINVQEVIFPNGVHVVLANTNAAPATVQSGTNGNTPNGPITTNPSGDGGATLINVPMSVHTVKGTGTYNVAQLDWGTFTDANASWFTFAKNSNGTYTIQDVHATGYTLNLTDIQEIIFPNGGHVVLSSVKLSLASFISQSIAVLMGIPNRIAIALSAYGDHIAYLVSGSKNVAAVLLFSAPSVDFGSVNVGSTATKTVTVTVAP